MSFDKDLPKAAKKEWTEDYFYLSIMVQCLADFMEYYGTKKLALVSTSELSKLWMQWVSTVKKAVLVTLNLDLYIKLLRIFKPVGFYL